MRRLVDAAGLSSRALEESTFATVSNSGQPAFYSKSQWGRWLNGQSRPPRKAVKKLTEKLQEEDIEAGYLVDLWGKAFVSAGYPQAPEATAATLRNIQWREPAMAVRPDRLPEADFLVGRDNEMGLLSGLIRDAAQGHGGSVLIEGEPGIGKSALVRAAVAEAPKGRLPGVLGRWRRAGPGAAAAAVPRRAESQGAVGESAAEHDRAALPRRDPRRSWHCRPPSGLTASVQDRVKPRPPPSAGSGRNASVERTVDSAARKPQVRASIYVSEEGELSAGGQHCRQAPPVAGCAEALGGHQGLHCTGGHRHCRGGRPAR